MSPEQGSEPEPKPIQESLQELLDHDVVPPADSARAQQSRLEDLNDEVINLQERQAELISSIQEAEQSGREVDPAVREEVRRNTQSMLNAQVELSESGQNYTDDHKT